MENKSSTCHMTNEKRLIDANAFREFWNKNYRHQYANDNFLIAIANFPTVDAVEVVHGRWLKATHSLSTGSILAGYSCSECDNFSVRNSNYCPNCGAKMDGGNDQ